MSRAMLVLVSAAVLTACNGEFAPISGYKPASDVKSTVMLGPAIESLDAAVGGDQRDWTAGNVEYERVHAEGMSLRNVLPASCNDCHHLLGATSYYESEDYMHEFVSDAIKGEGKFAGLDGKMREELTMKGVVLQGVLMASITSLHHALNACIQGKADETVHSVDKAWAFYASSESKGPIKLAEKRAPQFAVESTSPTEAGDSKVNVQLLTHFQTLQQDAKSMFCTNMQSMVPKVIALMQVPVIQGMLREAYEVDPNNHEETRGADGFVEVAEGWAFARAVLPAIHTCSADAAATIKKNMDTLALGAEGAHMPDGFVAVKDAVESVYLCLGISCADVNAMVSPWKTEELLWTPCTDAALQAASATQAPADLSGEEASGAEGVVGKLSIISAIVVAAMSYA